jgi:hypothetical protein
MMLGCERAAGFCAVSGIYSIVIAFLWAATIINAQKLNNVTGTDNPINLFH